MNPKRIVSNILLFISIIFAPWWVYVPLALILFIINFSYYEFILFAIFADILYGNPIVIGDSFSYTIFFGYLLTTWAILFFIVGTMAKSHIRIYNK